MRQGQQNRRGRGRNRKGQNPLTRSYESAGPDIKIRGTPAHIAEKYVTLARDATSSGDPVLAENYLQHAEHYNRIIMSFREQTASAGGEQMMNGGSGRHRAYMASDSMEPGEDYSEDEDDEGGAYPSQPVRRQQESQPQGEGQRTSVRRSRDRRERPERGSSGESQPIEASAQPQSAPEGQPRRRERFAEAHEQPEFLRRPVRRPRRESEARSSIANGGASVDESEHD